MELETKIIKRLNNSSRDERLTAAVEAAEIIEKDGLYPDMTDEVNNHIHTTFSFSPYSPSKSAFMARAAGLKAAGSVDHDSIGAAKEMVEACRAFGIGSTVGYEVRVNFTGTFLEDRKINNPDMLNNAYIVIHGVPHDRIDETAVWLQPINEQRNIRNRKQVEILNGLLPSDIEPLDFEHDVMTVSEVKNGGSITERHILYALALKIMISMSLGRSIIDFVRDKLDIEVPDKLAALLGDQTNPHYVYDLLGILKSGLVPRFYVEPNSIECPAASDAVAFANSIGAIPAYSYLGDIAESPTGDKKAEKFEDEYLEALIPLVHETGFKAIAYMPPRNSIKQLLRVQQLCVKYDFMQISGVDINSSRQEFRCPEIMLPEFSHLIDSTWALIAHEHLASADPSLALFSSRGTFSKLGLDERLRIYAEAGKQMDLHRPENIIDIIGRFKV